MFVRTGEAGALTDLTISWPDHRYFTGFAVHSGLSIDKFFQLQTEPTGAGKKPGKGTLIKLVAALVFQQAGHDLYYSDFHAAGAAQYGMSVIYTYLPNRPPVCAEATPSLSALWPPNGRFHAVDVLGVTDPDGDPVTLLVSSIAQDEPIDASGDGDTSPDGTGTGTSTAHVRAERSGTGDGRVYHIGFDAADGRGGSCTGTVNVSVPHDRSGAAIDGGALYDSMQ